MAIDKQKEILELRKIYLKQFEKYETKIFIAWFGIVVLPLFVLWLQGKIDGVLVLIIALFGCFLDIVLEAWRKKSFNDLITDIEGDKISAIGSERNQKKEKIVATPIIKYQKSAEPKETNSELTRLAIVTLLIAAMFGILQYFQGQTFDVMSIDVILKVVALVMLKATFPIFAIYLIVLGLDSRYEKNKTHRGLQAFFYDLGIFLTTFVIILASLFYFFVWLLVKIPTFPMGIIVGVLWAFIIISAIVIFLRMRHYLKKKR